MKICPKCKIEHNKPGLYCSRKCANSRVFSEEARQKKREKTNEAIKRGAYDSIKRRSKKARICLVCGNLHYKNTKTCSRECFKIIATINALKQIKHGSGKKGEYKNYKLDSTYELAFLIYHLDNNIEIKRSDLKIDYIYKNVKRIYNPDFEIDGVIYEIKGFYNKQSREKVRQANLQGYNIQLIDGKLIKPYIDFVKQKYNVGNHIELLYEDFGEKKCLHCETLFKPKTKLVKYCNLSCAAKHRHKIVLSPNGYGARL